MRLRIGTWNINSVRLRAPLLERLNAELPHDILCLQETKTPDAHFPHEALRGLGYTHVLIAGQKGYNGVAILSRVPLEHDETRDVLGDGSARHISARVAGRLTLHNVYIPAGGDVPDVTLNPKFAEKLAFVEHLRDWAPQVKHTPAVLCGDFNIAPLEHDVWSHRQLLGVVSHTPQEVERLEALRSAGDWVDSARHFTPAHEKLYSWWSYRNRDWRKSNRGRRLDHIWVTPPLRDGLKAVRTLNDLRDGEKPSDHVPVIAEFA